MQIEHKVATNISNINIDTLDLGEMIDHFEQDPADYYLINLDTIGEGSVGSVYMGNDKEKLEEVALKKIKLNQENFHTLAREIYIMKTAIHENLIQYFESYFHEDSVWIVMEYMNRGSLGEILDFHDFYPLSETHIRYIISEILKGIKYLHSLQRIHRDLKSDNILFSNTGQVKIADFGFTAQLTKDRGERDTVLGTPYWMSPEIIKGKKYGTMADIWGMGIILYEMTEGHPPYHNKSRIDALDLIQKKGCPNLRHPEDWSDGLRYFLKHCLKKKPEKRLNATELSKHPYVTEIIPSSKDSFIDFLDLIAEQKKILERSLLPPEQRLSSGRSSL
eukprot:TRINITY_DN1471_c0_g1_i2.p1 TRINITY_DN1471_c0_g1~~TRINITY_DN1471_c0_g1_i2.p1  ORF type:complete len:334 (+),score=63.36 TRINITY_DN1471_c0_g1_i2:332-1333(+)